MAIIQLRHHRHLGYLGSGRYAALPLPDEVGELAAQATVVTFRPVPSHFKRSVRKKIDATYRLLDLPAGDLLFYSIESDSPLAPLLLWDAAHAMAIGQRIILAGDLVRQCYLLRAYFAEALVQEQGAAGQVVLRKVQPLPAEKDAGRQAWTFAIPVGPEDATLLNVAVRRILELDIAEKEILLCGRPAANFQYWEQVRIVGEDITAPPVRICAKKNRLAQEAKYENLCIMHDRVFLPHNFSEAIADFGEYFPLTTFQSLYFDDRYNLVPRRYSDFGVAPRIDAMATLGVMRDNDVASNSPYAPAVLALTDKVGFFSGNARRYSPNSYPTGSLYLVKRSVWLRCEQDEDLLWTEFEDLEQAHRAESMGIPSRINPHGLTQSLIARPLLSTNGAVNYENFNGGLSSYRPTLERLPIPRKPLIKLQQSLVRENIARFEAKYVPPKLAMPLTSSAAMSTPLRLKTLVQLTHRVKVPIQRKAINTLLADYEKLLMADQMTYAWREDLINNFLHFGNAAISDLVANSDQLVNHASQRPQRQVFVASLRDYLPQRGLGVLLGSLWSSLSLYRRNRKVFYFPGGWYGCWRSILGSTPYSYYAEKKQ